MPKEFVKKYIDLLALHKLNIFHWHLTDDQGWRIEIKKYPQLTEVGAWRKETLVGRSRATTRHAARSTASATAASTRRTTCARSSPTRTSAFVTIVPEIEMPGHAHGRDRGVSRARHHRRHGGGRDDVGRLRRHPQRRADTTIAFMQDVLDRSAGALSRAVTSTSAATRRQGAVEGQRAHPGAHRRARTCKDEHELQSWFIRQMDAFLDARKAPAGRLGRDSRGRPRRRTPSVMSWRGTEGRHRRGARRPRCRHDADEPHLLRLLPVEGSGDASRSRSAASFRSKRSTLRAVPATSSSRSSPSTCSGAGAVSGRSTCRARSTSSTWPSRA